MKDAPVHHPAINMRRRAFTYLALSTIAIAQPLLQMYGDNVAIFAASNYEGAIVVWFAVAVLVLPPAVLLFVDGLGTKVFPHKNVAIHLVLVFLGLWAVSSVVLRSVSFGPWALDLVFTASVAGVITVAYYRISTVQSWLALLSPLAVLVLALFVLSASTVISPPAAKVLDIDRTDAASVEENKIPQNEVSVLWITLDEAPLFPLLNTEGKINAKRFPGFAELAGSSTWYRNALTTSQTTIDAVPAMLSGKWPTSGKGPVLANYPKNLFTLMNGHLSMDGHEVATALCPRDVCSTVSVSGGDHIADPSSIKDSTATSNEEEKVEGAVIERTKLSVFFRDASVVLGHKVLPAGLREKLPPIDEGWGGFGDIDNVESYDPELAESEMESGTLTTENLERAKSTTVRQWQSGGPMSQVPVVEDMVTRASRADRPTLHFAHVLLPHRPWTLAPDMRRSRALPTDKRSNAIVDRVRDEYQAHLLQYVATDNIIKKMMTTMKKSANWNRTMIIVTADHGITFMPGESKRKLENVAEPRILEDLYRVPMFIKYPAQMQGSVTDCPASSIDLLATVIGTTGVDAGWETNGSDLSTSCPSRPVRKVAWPSGSAQISTDFSAAVERARYYDKWVNANTGAIDIVRVGQHGAVVGTDVNATVPQDGAVTWSLDNADDFTKVGAGRFGFVPSQVQGTIRAQRDLARNEEALLMVGTRVVGVITEIAGLQSGQSTIFRSTLHWASLPAGKHTVNLWIVGRNSTGERTFTPQS